MSLEFVAALIGWVCSLQSQPRGSDPTGPLPPAGPASAGSSIHSPATSLPALSISPDAYRCGGRLVNLTHHTRSPRRGWWCVCKEVSQSHGERGGRLGWRLCPGADSPTQDPSPGQRWSEKEIFKTNVWCARDIYFIFIMYKPIARVSSPADRFMARILFWDIPRGEALANSGM